MSNRKYLPLKKYDRFVYEIVKQVIVIQHHESEGLGTFEPVLNKAKISVRSIRIFAGEKVPDRLGEEGDGLIVLGGSFGVYESEKYPFLLDEIRLIESALREGKPIFGICLGSQLLASALGAKVYKCGRQEIGWHPVILSEAAKADALWRAIENEFTAFHWHGDVFDLPARAVSLASSAMTEHQVFRYADKFYGILFHPEATKEIISTMTRDFAEEAAEAEAAPKEILKDTEKHLHAFQKIANKLFNQWTKLID